MAKKFNEATLDKRIVTRSIDKGIVTADEYKDFMSSLPDESKNADVQKCFSEEDNTLTFSSVETLKH